MSMFERDLAEVRRLGLKLAYTVDTHIHADHITGALELKRATGSRIAPPPSTACPAPTFPSRKTCRSGWAKSCSTPCTRRATPISRTEIPQPYSVACAKCCSCCRAKCWSIPPTITPAATCCPSPRKRPATRALAPRKRWKSSRTSWPTSSCHTQNLSTMRCPATACAAYARRTCRKVLTGIAGTCPPVPKARKARRKNGKPPHQHLVVPAQAHCCPE
ncbi:MAG: hypothetical protein ACXWVG_10180 [Telluria sp.]